MTITRAWWIVAGGMIVAVPGAIAVVAINRFIDLGPHLHRGLSYATRGIFFVGLAIAAVGVVEVVLTVARAFR